MFKLNDFSNYVLRRSDSLENLGSPHWTLTLCLLLAWIMVCCCIIQGIKSSGKVNRSIRKRISFCFHNEIGCLFYCFVSLCGYFCIDYSWCDFTR